MSTLPPLPPGWSEHKAPSGHTYYYNAQTKESTYRRPAAAAPTSLPPPPPPPPPPPASSSSLSAASLPAGSQPPPSLAFPPQRPNLQPPPAQYFPNPVLPQQNGPQPFLNLSDPRVANAFMAQHNAAAAAAPGRGRGDAAGGGGGRGGRGGFNARPPRPQPNDRPRSSMPIPGHEPWLLVYTKYGRRFVYNPAKNASYWRIPEKLMPAILEMDKAGVRPGTKTKKTEVDGEESEAKGDNNAPKGVVVVPLATDYDSEYEEVEVTDDEGDKGEDEGRRKRARTEDMNDDDDAQHNNAPIEFGEDDIAFQLAAANGMMDEQYYYDDDDGGDGDNPEADEEAVDGATLFKALLDDFKINPFSAWEKLIEDGLVFDDPRYTALPTMKARKAVWEEWSRDRIRAKKMQEAAEADNKKKKDPRAAYLKLLQDLATPKLYWAEFKRKYRKEPAMKDVVHVTDKEKEKLYRDYVARRKLPAATRKADLLRLLESLPPPPPGSAGHDNLPPELTSDMRYVAVEPAVRDPLVDAYLQSA